MRNILVIGSLNMDMVVHLDEIPRVGQTLLGRFQGYIPGGKGANQAFAAARLGEGVSMLGKVGDDLLGKQLIESLACVGVDISNIVTEKDETSGLAIIYVSDEGNNSIVVLPAANFKCDAKFISDNEHLIAQSEIVLIQLEIPLDAAFLAVRLAKKHGCTVILNPAPAPDEIPDEILKLVSYITPNETELEKLSGIHVEDSQSARTAANKLIKRGVENVIATLGKGGALLVREGESVIFEVKDIEVVDTTAAGDTFNAGLAVALSEGMDIMEAIGFANKAATICVSRSGAQPSIPSRAEVDLLLS